MVAHSIQEVFLSSITGRCRQVTSRAVIIGLLIMPVNFYWIIIAKEPYPLPVSSHQFRATLQCGVYHVCSSGHQFSTTQVFSKWSPQSGRIADDSPDTELHYNSGRHGYDADTALRHGACLQFSTVENEWGSLFHHYIPEWLSVRDASVLEPYYNGDSSFYHLKYVFAWLSPALL